MMKIHSPGKPYKGMAVVNYFKISSIDDYKKSLQATSVKLPNRAAYEAYICEHDKRFHFFESLDRAVSGAEAVLFLSVGDGAKEFFFINKYPEKAITISDVDASVLQRIKEFSNSTRCNILVSTSLQVPVPDESFDAICVLNAEYFYNDNGLQKMLNEMARILRKGGSLYLASYCIIPPNASFSDAARASIAKLLNKSTILAIFTNLLFKFRLVAFSGYRRTLSDFVSVFTRSPLCLKKIEFEGGAKEPKLGGLAALFELRK